MQMIFIFKEKLRVEFDLRMSGNSYFWQKVKRENFFDSIQFQIFCVGLISRVSFEGKIIFFFILTGNTFKLFFLCICNFFL